MNPSEVESLTPREFAILMQAENDRQYDEYERMAIQALMITKAERTKKPKLSDLFKRPSADDVKPRERKSINEMRREVDEINEWLATLSVEERGD